MPWAAWSDADAWRAYEQSCDAAARNDLAARDAAWAWYRFIRRRLREQDHQ